MCNFIYLECYDNEIIISHILDGQNSIAKYQSETPYGSFVSHKMYRQSLLSKTPTHIPQNSDGYIFFLIGFICNDS